MTKRIPAGDKKAKLVVLKYAADYAVNRPLKASSQPRLSAGFESEYGLGWPVRNLDGGGNIAYFSSYEAADSAANEGRR